MLNASAEASIQHATTKVTDIGAILSLRASVHCASNQIQNTNIAVLSGIWVRPTLQVAVI